MEFTYEELKCIVDAVEIERKEYGYYRSETSRDILEKCEAELARLAKNRFRRMQYAENKKAEARR